MAPTIAVSKILDRAHLALQDFDFYEIHEAFAAQVLATLRAWEDAEYCKNRLGQDASARLHRSRQAQRQGLVAGLRPSVRCNRRTRACATCRSCLADNGGARPDLDLHRGRYGRAAAWRVPPAPKPAQLSVPARPPGTQLDLQRIAPDRSVDVVDTPDRPIRRDITHERGTMANERRRFRGGARWPSLAGSAALLAGDKTASARTVSETTASPRPRQHLPHDAAMVEGPFYFDPDPRAPGHHRGPARRPLHIDLQITDGATRQPIEGARVDLWHCNATGQYSGYDGQGDDWSISTRARSSCAERRRRVPPAGDVQDRLSRLVSRPHRPHPFQGAARREGDADGADVFS